MRVGLRSERAAQPPLPPGLAGRLATAFESGLDAAALIFFPLLVLAPRGIAALTSVAGLLALCLLAASGDTVWLRSRLRSLAAPAALLGSLLVWGAVSAAWSLDPPRSVELAARLAGLSAAGLVLAAAAGSLAAPRQLSLLLGIGFVIGLAVAIADFATHGAVSGPFSSRAYQPARLNQATVGFAILLAPASALLACLERKISSALLALAAVASVCVLAGTAAKTALAFALPMAVVVYAARAWAIPVAASISVLIAITAPLTFARLERLPAFTQTADTIKQSFGHRLLIWSFAGDRIDEHPLAGWGLDASRTMPGGSEPIEPGETWLPLHPHNAPLQLWLELGVPGAVLFALTAAYPWLALAAAEWPALFTAAAGAALTAAFVASLGTYGIWQEWWQGTLWFSLFLVLVMGRAAVKRDRRSAAAA